MCVSPSGERSRICNLGIPIKPCLRTCSHLHFILIGRSHAHQVKSVIVIVCE